MMNMIDFVLRIVGTIITWVIVLKLWDWFDLNGVKKNAENIHALTKSIARLERLAHEHKTIFELLDDEQKG